MQIDIAEYSKPVIRTDPRMKFDPDLLVPRKMGKRGKKNSRKPTGKSLIQALSKRVGKYGLINNLAQARTGITFGQIAGGDKDFAKAYFEKILPSRLNRATVIFAVKN